VLCKGLLHFYWKSSFLGSIFINISTILWLRSVFIHTSWLVVGQVNETKSKFAWLKNDEIMIPHPSSFEPLAFHHWLAPTQWMACAVFRYLMSQESSWIRCNLISRLEKLRAASYDTLRTVHEANKGYLLFDLKSNKNILLPSQLEEGDSDFKCWTWLGWPC